MKRFIAATLLAVVVQAPTCAEPPGQLPEAMVMVAPPLLSVAGGQVAQRLVHGQFVQHGDQITATIRFIATPATLRWPCPAGADDNLPNVCGEITLNLNEKASLEPRNVAVAFKQASKATIEEPAGDYFYYQEIRRLLTSSKLEIEQHDGLWTMTGDNGVSSTAWRPMSLKQASDTVYFVRTLRPAAYDIERCVASQIAQVEAIDSPTAEQTSLLNAVSLVADKARFRAQNDTEGLSDAIFVDLAAQLLSESGDFPADLDAFLAKPPFQTLAENAEKKALLRENFERIVSAARYMRRLKEFYEAYPRREQVEIICHDVVTLKPEGPKA